MRAKRGWLRQVGDALRDEQGKTSIGRILLVLHVSQNWLWINAIVFGLIRPPDSRVLDLLIGSLDVTIFLVLGAWVIGPRSFQYIFPQIGAAVSAVSRTASGYFSTSSSFASGGYGGPTPGYKMPSDIPTDDQPDREREGDEP